MAWLSESLNQLPQVLIPEAIQVDCKDSLRTVVVIDRSTVVELRGTHEEANVSKPEFRESVYLHLRKQGISTQDVECILGISLPRRDPFPTWRATGSPA